MVEIHKKFVAGVVNISPVLGKDHPYTFFEIDVIDEKTFNQVLVNYERFNIDVVSHRIGKGYHFFGGNTDRQIWKEWYSKIKHLNLKYPPLTLRITRKFDDEIFERPVYHEAQSKPLDWSRSLMYFLNKELRRENSTNLHESMNRCSLSKYFKVVVYPLDSGEKK